MSKVLIVANSSWNIFNFRMELIKEIIKKGNKIVVSCPADKYSYRIKLNKIKFIPINYRRNSINFYENLKIIINYLFVLRNENPNIILLYTIKPNIFVNISALFSFRKYKIYNFITGIGNLYFENNLKKKIIFILYKIAFKISQKVIFQNSQDLKYFVTNKIIESSKCVLIPGSGIDIFKYKYNAIKNNKSFTFLCVSRLIKHKGINEYVNAAKKIKKKYPSTRFILAGSIDSEYSSSIDKNTINNLHLHLDYRGFSDNITELMNECDCFVLPSYREGTSRSLLEAAAIGKPIVTSNVPGCNNIVINDFNGYLCKPMDEISLFKSLEKMINTNFETRKKMSKNSRKLVEKKFESRIINKQILQLINL